MGFADPSSLPEHPGWPLRNLLVFAQHQWHVQHINVLCYRELTGRDILESIFLTVEVPHISVASGRKQLYGQLSIDEVVN